MTQRQMLWAAVACAALVAGQAQAQAARSSRATVQQVVVRPAAIHTIPDDPAADDANPILNPGLNSGLNVGLNPAPNAGAAPSDAPSAPEAKLVAVKLVEVQPSAPEVALDAPAPNAAPAVDAGPRVAVGRRIVDAAGAFDGYMHRAAAIKADFADGDAVTRAVTLGSVYQPGQLEQGAIAFAALLALQDPAFVRAVHDLGENPEAREAFTAHLVDHPKTVLDAPAARRAATRVAGVLGHMGVDLVAAGAAVKQAAYDVQAQGWSKQAITGSDRRLETLRAQSARSVSLVPADTAHLIADLGALKTATPDLRAADDASPVITRGLAVAALAVLGEAGEDDAERVAPLLTEAVDAQCIKMAQLNLMQCLSVAGPHYEDAFCLGRHAMMETGQCVAKAAGMTTADLKPAADTRSVLVPVALAPAPLAPAAPAPAVSAPLVVAAEAAPALVPAVLTRAEPNAGPEAEPEAGPEAGMERNAVFGGAPAVRDEVAIPVAVATAAAVAPPAPAYSPYDGPGEK